jgi:uncharacterized LabA/DUF88 family protein
MRKEKIFAFIDGQNLNLGIRTQGWILDLKKFRIYLHDKYKVSAAFYFIGYIESNKRFYKFLENSGYKTIFKPTLTYRKSKKHLIKGNVDAELVLHTMIEFQNYSSAIIISGDGDFYSLIKYLKSKKKLSKILIPNRNKYSSLLNEFSSQIEYLNELYRKLSFNNFNKKERH